jgi:hypothetical protein
MGNATCPLSRLPLQLPPCQAPAQVTVTSPAIAPDLEPRTRELVRIGPGLEGPPPAAPPKSRLWRLVRGDMRAEAGPQSPGRGDRWEGVRIPAASAPSGGDSVP